MELRKPADLLDKWGQSYIIEVLLILIKVVWNLLFFALERNITCVYNCSRCMLLERNVCITIELTNKIHSNTVVSLLE